MVVLQQWLTLAIAQWLVLWPMVLLGVCLSTAALMLTPRPWWEKMLPQNPWGQLLSGLTLGLLLPLGTGGAPPLVRRLFWQTGSTAGAIAFWLTTVSLNPFVLWALWQQLLGRGGLVFFYGSLSLTIVVFISGIFTFERQRRSFPLGEAATFIYPAIARPSSYRLPSTQPEAPSTISKLTILPTIRRFRSLAAAQNFVQELLEWSAWLLIACGVMAGGQLLFPLEALLDKGILGLLGAGFLYAIQPATTAAIADLSLGNYSSGVALGLLLTGTFLNGISLIFLINVVRWRAYSYLVLLLGLSVLALDLWLNFYVF
ncbi:permease [Picosynechococcus sp. NKBG15041c]|uniref:permease n=1 Tax=Picosynechococcus sp. NKBG15041c TaxID=1407650 RepID=UPI001F34B56D|nr:permease [Picosynechococcus sp. NKBG15041c]